MPLNALKYWWMNPNFVQPQDRSVAFTEVELFNRALAEVADYRITTETRLRVVSASNTRPVVIRLIAHGYDTEDRILLTDFNIMRQLNGRIFQITVLTLDTFELDREDGTTSETDNSGGFARRISTGRHVDAVFDVWPSIRPEVLQLHSWNEATVYKRLARLDNPIVITGISNEQIATVTSVAHPYVQGDQCLIEDVAAPMIELNNRFFNVGAVTANTFDLAGEDSSSYATYVSGGTAKKVLTPLRPDFGFGFRYPLPADTLRVLNIANPSQEDWAWERSGQTLLTDVEPTVQIRYTVALLSPETFGPQLVAALSARLAHEVAPILSDSPSREERAAERWKLIAATAKRTDGTEQSSSHLTDSSWFRARFTGGFAETGGTWRR